MASRWMTFAALIGGLVVGGGCSSYEVKPYWEGAVDARPDLGHVSRSSFKSRRAIEEADDDWIEQDSVIISRDEGTFSDGR